ncbi:MAG: serine/threonine-protein kinase [Polyangiales bacterium]
MSTPATNTAHKQAAQPDELIGRVINDRFRIISVIARGGMGRVYRAEQVPLGRLVAIKTLDLRHEGGNHDPLFQQRFFLEASVASKLQHPNTVTVFDYGRTADDLYFIAMELVEGRTLHNLIRTESPVPHTRVVHIAMQIARSLREAHRLEVIHRDLKPGNVLLSKHGDEEDFVKVLDFGLVKHVESEAEQELTKAGLFMGSPKYMAPEQIRGEDAVDGRADIYALGVVMYEMLTGKVPFDRENTVKVLMAHLHEPPPPLSAAGCPDTLAQLVMRCLAKSPDQRPSSMDELIKLLKYVDGVPSTPSGQFALSQMSQEIRMPRVGDSTLPPVPSVTPDNRNFVHTESGVITNAGRETIAGSSGPGLLPKLAVIAALGIAGGFLALRFSERGSSLSVQPNAPSASPSATREAPAPATPQAHVLVRLTSEPSGATVSADGRVYGQTPADIEWWGEPAEQGRQITFEFTKDGFEKVTVVRELHGEKLDVEATLPAVQAPRASAPAESRRRHRTPARRDEASSTPSPAPVPRSFKDDPY